ncbi:cobalt-precorrin-6A reductase [Corynebacterium poyangense]|uniref:Cobalt-precorrin-6A reductase n=1 Tax=Corynebacterium poyangense TaxID=2684405 RepID=A0A7H0SNT9_9CORY|nr:precorrin-6A/cobalt-precorrin-6A reductase [Corynebacterium poyangense]MBZ8177766.1 cobalt-precorrin-6A reductase [Corynebacterium poyangense]QNQ90214.1 cobalt-precorrin-6A reductase [Corynebacterium poyangense]
MRVLIIGGSEPAHMLAHELVQRQWWVTTVLPEPGLAPAGQVRIGDLGGPAGLARFIINHGVEFIIDASHPFAETPSLHASEAARATGTPYFQLTQPPWQPGPQDRWQIVGDTGTAARLCARNFHHILLDFWKAPHLAQDFHEDHDNLYVLRTPAQGRGRSAPGRTPPRFRILPTPPSDVSVEKQLLRDNQIDGIVLRNTGDSSAEPTLDAARELAIPVVLIDRPPTPPALVQCHSLAEVLDALHAR